MAGTISQQIMATVENTNGTGLVEHLRVKFPRAKNERLLDELEFAETTLSGLADQSKDQIEKAHLRGLTRRLIGAQGVVREQAHAMTERTRRGVS